MNYYLVVEIRMGRRNHVLDGGP